MGRGLQAFKQKDVTRLLKAARDARYDRAVVKVDRHGNLFVFSNSTIEELDHEGKNADKDTWSDE